MYEKRTIEIEGSPMEVLVFEPEGSGPFPGVVVAQHIPIAHEGLEKDPFTKDVGERLAKAGYASVIPFVFHWWPPEEDIAVKREQFRDDRAVADLNAAFDILEASDKVDANRIGIMGHCWGGRLSWLHACHNPDYKGAVVLYGGRIKLGMGEGSPPPIDLCDRIPCPVLGIFGNDDENPSPADVKDLDAALTKAGIDHDFHCYDGAGHGFQDFCSDERYRKEAAEDAWGKILGFFDKTL
ncbi:MAG: dienelactone hydrolase family protein [Alphaproteobacteria bacterium]|nr:dienelactone hydrolase family protein [Alphaproteobacteria bacterium]